jgi:hypothetical protein
MLRDLVAGQGCSAGVPGGSNALRDLASSVLHGQRVKGVEEASTSLQGGDLRLNDAQAASTRARTSVVARHFSAELATAGNGASPLLSCREQDDARYSAFLNAPQQQGMGGERGN